MVLLISYDLNGQERPSAYVDVKKTIEANASSFIKPLYSQWFVETRRSPVEWRELLTDNVIDIDDKLFILKVEAPYAGWLKSAHWAWLRERV